MYCITLTSCSRPHLGFLPLYTKIPWMSFHVLLHKYSNLATMWWNSCALSTVSLFALSFVLNKWLAAGVLAMLVSWPCHLCHKELHPVVSWYIPSWKTSLYLLLDSQICMPIIVYFPTACGKWAILSEFFSVSWECTLLLLSSNAKILNHWHAIIFYTACILLSFLQWSDHTHDLKTPGM